MNFHTSDLSEHPPRSARVRLGGFVILPRILDKGRAVVSAKNGEYKYACPLDERFLEFAGIDADALKTQIAAGKSDSQILEWILSSSKTKPSAIEIAAWSRHQEERVPSDPESRAYLNDLHAKIAPHRADIGTWFDLLDLDDYVSFGGQS